MANSFALASGGETVFGNMRVRMGTLTMGDSSTGSSVASGFGFLYGGLLTPASAGMAAGIIAINSNVNGDFKALSCTSADTFQVVLFGR